MKTKQTYMHDVLEDLPGNFRTKLIAIIVAIVFFVCVVLGGIMFGLAVFNVAHADERPYTRWFVVAYFDGIDKPYKHVAKPFTNSTDCGDRIIAAKEANRIADHIVVGCKMWTAQSPEKKS